MRVFSIHCSYLYEQNAGTKLPVGRGRAADLS
jgi:hypothetical protein